eukprot:295331-Prymnesium_polylepis.1
MIVTAAVPRRVHGAQERGYSPSTASEISGVSSGAARERGERESDERRVGGFADKGHRKMIQGLETSVSRRRGAILMTVVPSKGSCRDPIRLGRRTSGSHSARWTRASQKIASDSMTPEMAPSVAWLQC